jgi:transposase, IS5 family
VGLAFADAFDLRRMQRIDFGAALAFPDKFITGKVRRVTTAIRRQMRRRAAIEPVIGHVKAEHRMGRNYLKGRIAPTPCSPPPDTTSACSWFEWLWRALLLILSCDAQPSPA